MRKIRELPRREDGAIDLESVTNAVMQLREVKPDNELLAHFEEVCLRAIQLEAVVDDLQNELLEIGERDE